MLKLNPLSLISILSFVLMFLLLLIQNNLKHSAKIYRSKTSLNVDEISLTIYNKLCYLPFIAHYARLIESRLLITTADDEQNIKISAFKIIMIAFSVLLFLFLFFLQLVKTWYLWIALIILFYFILETVIDTLIESVKLQLLEQLITFIDYVRNSFLENKMIDEAFIEALEQLGDKYNYIKKQILSIYKVLVAADGEIALENYYQFAPNPYFKILAGLSYIVREYGDTNSDSGSAYIKSLSHLSAEIKDDILRKKKLRLGLSSLNIIAIFPILMMQPLKNWASSSFYPLKIFYESSLGFIVEIVLLLIILSSFMALRRIQAESVLDGKLDDIDLDKLFLYKKIRFIAEKLLPASTSKAYKNLKLRQEKAYIFKPLTYHYYKKIIMTSLSFLLLVFIFILTYSMNLSAVYNAPTSSDSYFSAPLEGENYDLAMKLTTKDNQILAINNNWQELELASYLEQKMDLSGVEKRLTLKRILDKQERLKDARISPFKIICAYLILVLAWHLPDLHLYLREKLLRIDIDLEITRFQLVVTMLMHVENMTVDRLLVWLEIFSQLFKHPLQIAIMNYDAGAVDALKELKKASSKVAYQTLINHLINSTESLSIAESFSEFDIEKQYYQDKRKLINHHIVKKKIFWGQVIGFVPLYALMIIYFMLPLIYVSMNELQVYFDKLAI